MYNLAYLNFTRTRFCIRFSDLLEVYSTYTHFSKALETWNIAINVLPRSLILIQLDDPCINYLLVKELQKFGLLFCNSHCSSALHCIGNLLVLVLAVNQITDQRNLPDCFAIVFFQSSIRRIILRLRFEYQTIQTRVDISNTNDSAKKNMFSLCEIYSRKLLT